MPERSIIFAGGGSGGHIAPGLAIAERLQEIEPGVESLFLCSTRSIDAAMLTEAGTEFMPLPATPPSIKPLAASRFMVNFLASKRLAARLMRQRRISHVVALGGFVAAPVVSAARARGISVMLVNLDAPPGKANLWMAKRCDEVISAIPLPTMPRFASRVVGMPVRKSTLAPGDPRHCRVRLRLDPQVRTLLVTGASQGAISINAFMTGFARANSSLFGGDGWQILHLAGHGGDEPIRCAYEKAGVRATVLPFLNQMGLAWGAADLAVSRAGASSVAEAAHNAVPTLFLPYPYHKDMHQKHNAQPLVDLAAAAMATDHIDEAVNLEKVGPMLLELMHEDSKRAAMQSQLRAQPFPDAAMTIARMLAAKSTRACRPAIA